MTKYRIGHRGFKGEVYIAHGKAYEADKMVITKVRGEGYDHLSFGTCPSSTPYSETIKLLSPKFEELIDGLYAQAEAEGKTLVPPILDRFFVYDCGDLNDFEICDTAEEAKALADKWLEDVTDDEFGTEYIDFRGTIGWGAISEMSKFSVCETPDDYGCICGECTKPELKGTADAAEECDSYEPWPYGGDCDKTYRSELEAACPTCRICGKPDGILVEWENEVGEHFKFCPECGRSLTGKIGDKL